MPASNLVRHRPGGTVVKRADPVTLVSARSSASFFSLRRVRVSPPTKGGAASLALGVWATMGIALRPALSAIKGYDKLLASHERHGQRQFLADEETMAERFRFDQEAAEPDETRGTRLGEGRGARKV